MRGIFFDEEHARAAAARLAADGWQAGVQRERLAGEDDDEDHPWAVVGDVLRHRRALADRLVVGVGVHEHQALVGGHDASLVSGIDGQV